MKHYGYKDLATYLLNAYVSTNIKLVHEDCIYFGVDNHKRKDLKYFSPMIVYYWMSKKLPNGGSSYANFKFNYEQFREADPIRPPEKKGDKPILYYERLLFFLEWIGEPEPTPYQLKMLRECYNIIKPRKKPIKLI